MDIKDFEKAKKVAQQIQYYDSAITEIEQVSRQLEGREFAHLDSVAQLGVVMVIKVNGFYLPMPAYLLPELLQFYKENKQYNEELFSKL